MSTLRRISGMLLVLCALDLLVVVVTGNASLLTGLGPGVNPAGFVTRATLTLGLFVLRCRLLPSRERRVGTAGLIFALLLLPTLVEFQLHGGRINGDGTMYYVYVRSLVKDLDIDLTNEYTHYGLITRSDLAMPTKTGLRRSIFSIGPAVVSIPFFLLGEGIGRAQAVLGQEVDFSGYGPVHRNAVALGGFLYGFAAILLMHALLRRHFTEATALFAAVLVWGATFLPWYMVQQPTMSHAHSACAAALGLWLWDRDRDRRTPTGYLLLGLVLGLAMCIRWQNGILLVLPGLDLVGAGWKDRSALPRLASCGALLGAGALAGAAPQMFAWKALYDMWVLPYPPHGTDFLRFDHPFVLQTLFSSRHGLLSWTPVFWAGYLGFLALLVRRPALARALVIPLLAMTYVNMCSGDWWAGGSFSNRRFDSLLPILALGFAASLDVLRSLLRARPAVVLGLLAGAFATWNVALAEQFRRGSLPRDDTFAFPRLVGNTARLVADAVGSPTTWPASWLFAWQQGRPPSQYDLLVGRYLFYRQNNMSGHIPLGVPDDEAMLGEGWGPPESREGVPGRRLRGRARLFAPLDVPEDLDMRFRAAAEAPREIVVRVNGREAGRFWVVGTWNDYRLRVTASFWRRELNEVTVEAPEGDVLLGSVDFAKRGKVNG